MIFIGLCFSLGIISTAYLPDLPPLFSSSCVFVFVLALYFLFRARLCWLAGLLAFVTGCGYGIVSGYWFLNHQIQGKLAGEDILVQGIVVDLPQENKRRQLFTIKVTQAYLQQQPLKEFPAKINLSSYGELRVKPGEVWQFSVKLKVPRGFVNPGGYDYQASLLRRGIGATGYIRNSEKNTLLQSSPSFSIDVLRYQLQQWLLGASDSEQKNIMVALLVGDTSQVSKDQWGEMIKTGTNHLIAISGLHLGFFAIVGFFIGNFIGRSLQLIFYKIPSQYYGHFCAFTFTLFYSFIAGLNIPTLRTLIMLAVVQITFVLRRSSQVSQSLVIALVLTLLYDPLATCDMGFWLSFAAVGMLVFCFSGRIRQHQLQSELGSHIVSYCLEFIKSQWVMFIGLLVPLAVLVHTSSLLAPAANFFAIPVITFLVVPCLIIAAIFHLCGSGFESVFLNSAEFCLAQVERWLGWLLHLGAGNTNPLVNFNPLVIPLALFSIFLILLPRGLANKKLGFCGLALAFVIPLAQIPALQILVFDVGQGTAVLIRTPAHQMIYDTGPQYTENFDAGSGIIIPYLQSQGIRDLDRVVVSHNDQDHSGGVLSLLAGMQVKELWLGEPEKFSAKGSTSSPGNCHEAEPWQWEDVHFRFITWDIPVNAKANNHSCVLEITYRPRGALQRILLTGDIEKDAERALLEAGALEPVTLLLAPHHGSHSSSTEDFVDATRPEWVVYSTGYHNQHKHPHKDVVARYQAWGSHGLNTAYQGALEFTWPESGPMQVKEFRKLARRYWYAMDSDNVEWLRDKN